VEWVVSRGLTEEERRIGEAVFKLLETSTPEQIAEMVQRGDLPIEALEAVAAQGQKWEPSDQEITEAIADAARWPAAPSDREWHKLPLFESCIPKGRGPRRVYEWFMEEVDKTLKKRGWTWESLANTVEEAADFVGVTPEEYWTYHFRPGQHRNKRPLYYLSDKQADAGFLQPFARDLSKEQHKDALKSIEELRKQRGQ
jgi:lambda repressor-like predicted transcriptional regulator